MCGSSAPDYTPVAQASEEAARIGAELGNKQLDFAKQQYEESKPLYERLVSNQEAISNQTMAQGQDYYDYMVANQRPVEAALNKEAMAAGSSEMQAQQAARAGADMRTQIGNQYDQAIRAGLRYGMTPGSLGKSMRGAGIGAASSVAGAMTQAAERERQQGYAKRLDVAGLYRGLPGASAAAYGASIAAGNSAGQNQMAPGAQYMGGMAQGAGTIQQGLSTKIGGLTGALNAQGDQAAASGANMAAGIGTALGLVAAFSDRRLKKNIVRVGTRPDGLGVYAFEYLWGGATQIGVMADEVLSVYPDAVSSTNDGYMVVDYGRL